MWQYACNNMISRNKNITTRDSTHLHCLVVRVVCTVHFGYSGHLGPDPSVHYIRMSTICEVSSIRGVRGNLESQC